MNETAFAGRTVLVTGGASGIGRATAHRFAALGAQVRIGDVDESGLLATCADHPSITAMALDVSDEASVVRFVQGAEADVGAPDVLVNLAGILGFTNTHELAFSDWQRVIDVNLTGTFLMCREGIKAMLAKPHHGKGVPSRGVIINTASTAAHIGQVWAAAYGASKGGILALTRSLAVEYGRRGIRVNSISPGSIDTPMISNFAFPEGADESLLARTVPLAGVGSSHDVAAAIAYLASDEAGFVSGADLRIDGATTA